LYQPPSIKLESNVLKKSFVILLGKKLVPQFEGEMGICTLGSAGAGGG
jgi:hypothetical protein